MSHWFKKISFLIFALGFLTLNFSAYSHQPLPIPQPYPYPYPTQGICNPYTHGSICFTQSGNCALFVVAPQPTWFSGCMGTGFAQFCVNIPTFPAPFVQNACYQKSTPCTCSYGFINGYYIYEYGNVW